MEDGFWFLWMAFFILTLAQIYDQRKLRRLSRDLDSIVAAMLLAGTLQAVDVSDE